MPIINAAFDRQGGVCLQYDGYDIPPGFNAIVDGYRQTFNLHGVTPANTIDQNGYATAARQEQILALDGNLHSRVDYYGQRVANAIILNDNTLLPQYINEHPF